MLKMTAVTSKQVEMFVVVDRNGQEHFLTSDVDADRFAANLDLFDVMRAIFLGSEHSSETITQNLMEAKEHWSTLFSIFNRLEGTL